MNLINKYEGAVFFVDLLGITALTNGLIPLENKNYECWLKQYDLDNNNQYLAAALLSEFRNILVNLNERHSSVKVTQLSDCAFICSENISDIVLFSSQFMTKAINAGLLCRGGMSYGEIIETNQNHDLKRFIVGNAVTMAAKLEGIAKGSRVLIDKDFPHYLTTIDRNFAMRTNVLFSHFTNPVDFTVYDEFKWYLYPSLTEDIKDISTMAYEERKTLTKLRLKIANKLIFSPKFGWNSKSKEGIVHLKATINFMVENGLLDIYHDFDWEDLVSKREEGILEKANRMIDYDLEYYPREYTHLLDLL